MATVSAAVVQYHNKALWQAAVSNSYQTIGFTEYSEGTIISTQYANRGADFTDANDFIHWSDFFVNDGAGLQGYFPFDDRITVRFAVPQHWIAADFSGDVRMNLYNDNNLLFASGIFGGSGIGFFGGIVSDIPFNRVVFTRDDGTPPFIDDVFYEAVPAPGAMALFEFAAAALHCRTRRRRFAE